MAQGTVSPYVALQFFTNTGAVAAGYQLFTYTAGTSTKVSTYTDVAMAVPNANPIILDSAGRCTVFLATGSSYKYILAPPGDTDPPSSPVWTRDNISAIPGSASATDNDVSGTAGETITAGQSCYLSDGTGGTTAGRWYKTSATNTYSSTLAAELGFAVNSVSVGSAGTFRVSGRITGLSGLTGGVLYYLDTVAGGLIGTPPTNARVIAQADTSTTAIISWASAGIIASATTPGIISTVAQTLGAGAKSLTVGTATFASASTLLNFIFGKCSATITKNNNSTFADVTGLAFAVGASDVWAFQFNLYGVSSSTANFKFTLTGPAAPTALRFGVLNPAAATGLTSETTFGNAIVVSGIGAAPSVDQALVLHGLLRNGSTAGTVQLQFAQNANEVANSRIYIESYVLAWRVQ